MIEEIILNYLSQQLDCPVLAEEPTDKVKKYVLIEKTGGSSESQLNYATVIIQSYDTSLFKAATLNERIKDLMDHIVILNEIAKCKLNADYNFTDSETKRYRYQAVFNLIFYKK